MIYTVTLNPAIDLVIKLPNEFSLGNLNRASEENMFAGGKGINVSRVLKTLGRESTAIGFAGGFTGKYISDSLSRIGIPNKFIQVKENTRINVKILGKKETEINGPSPKLTEENCNELINSFKNINKNDLVIISGAIPSSLPLEVFENVLRILNENGVRFVLDTNGEPLLKALKYRPFLIKPNKTELEEIFKTVITSEVEIKKYAMKLVYLGAENVMVSLGKDGAIFANKTEFYKAEALKGKVINTVGAGDSSVAGFIDEYLNTNDFNKSLLKAVLVGSATAFSEDLANKILIDQLLKEAKICE